MSKYKIHGSKKFSSTMCEQFVLIYKKIYLTICKFNIVYYVCQEILLKVLYTKIIMNSCPFMPKPNEGKTDRTIRIVLGVILLGLAFFSLSGLAQIVAGIAGAIALITGVVGFCGLYTILGITTLEKK